MGQNTIIGPNFTVYTSNHNYDADYLPYGFDDFIDTVKIEENVWIGGNVIITKGLTISEGAVIGAGSVVTKDIPPYSIVAGNPATIIKTRDINKYQELKKQKKFYLKKKRRHNKKLS